MADTFEIERQEFIEKLKETDKLFDTLFNLDKTGMIIGGNEQQKLTDLRRSNKRILRKLETREFSVAIVGLEKAGKSTFGNALIEQDILPAEGGRCTFTTTEIRAGEKDEVEISFFSKNEFEKRLQDMFKTLNYDGIAKLAPFKKWWEDLQPKPSDISMKNMVEDIITILSDNTYEQYLDMILPPFDNPDEIKDKSKYFITGIVRYEKDDKADNGKVAVKCSVPYAVKNIKISSTKLQKMKHIVLYDVPGFNSPTKIHKEQTLDMMRSADVIIFLTDVNKPSLESSQLDVFKTNEDYDGFKLNNKTFVFGNQIDKSNTKADSNDNRATLKKDILKYDIALENRILFGSARAYLEKKGLMGDSKNAMLNLEKLEMSDGIEELRNDLQKYYDNDRFKILKDKANKTINDIKVFLQEIKDNWPPEKLDGINYGGNIYVDINNAARDIFIPESSKLRNEYSEKIEKERIFSNSLENSLDTIFKNECEELFKEVEYDTTYKTGVVPYTTIDGKLREKMQQGNVKNLVEKVASITKEQQQEIMDKLVDCFLDDIKTEHKTDELRKSVNELFDKFLIKNGSDCQFNVLVERFATGLIESLIFMPYASSERKDKIHEIEPDLINLGYYYSLNDDRIGQSDTAPEVYIATRILCHIDPETYFGYGSDEERISLWEENNFKFQSKEQIKEVLSEDINILVDIAKKSLFDVIGLEKAFNRVIDKNISLINDNIRNNEGGKGILGVWINDNARKIRPSEFADIDVEIENNKIRKDIVKSIDEVLKNWNN